MCWEGQNIKRIEVVAPKEEEKVWIWEQTAVISLYNINWLVFITETECVYCAVRAESLSKIQGNFLSAVGRNAHIARIGKR
jgi:hypothetical protein